jgi:phage baseplate assembly protein gpV
MGDVESGFIMPGSIYTGTNAAPASASGSYVLEVPAGGSFEIRVGGSSMVFANGKITLNGDIEVTGDVKAGAISLKTHTHGGVQAGGAQTSTPS